jgi:hypothetical protein
MHKHTHASIHNHKHASTRIRIGALELAAELLRLQSAWMRTPTPSSTSTSTQHNHSGGGVGGINSDGGGVRARALQSFLTIDLRDNDIDADGVCALRTVQVSVIIKKKKKKVFRFLSFVLFPFSVVFRVLSSSVRGLCLSRFVNLVCITFFVCNLTRLRSTHTSTHRFSLSAC